MAVKQSIAIIGEGETEWFYFDSLRRACHYHQFKVAPDFPQHSDIPHMVKLAEAYVTRQYDYIICLVDMDRLFEKPKEMEVYRRLCKKANKKIMWIETNPCTEFWFLLHFLPEMAVKHYQSYDELLPDLQKYMPGYEKTQRYFKKTDLYRFITENGDLTRAIRYASELSRLSQESPEDAIAYSQIHRVFELIAELSKEDCISETKKDNQIQIEDKRQVILRFIADNGITDLRTISKAVDLKVSRLRDYLKQLVDEGMLEIEGEYANKKYKICD